MKTHFILFLFWLLGLSAQAQTLHSHNDYRQKVPFWEAYSQGMGLIEADLFLRNGSEIVVCHDRWEIDDAPLFEELYLKPIAGLDTFSHHFTLLIDFKDRADRLMQPLVELLNKYPSVFCQEGVKVIINGARPPKQEWIRYADYILFDGRPNETYSPQELSKVFMISQSLDLFTSWNGKGTIPPAELVKVKEVVANAHALNKPFRFWGCADNPNTWLALHKMGVDIINTDRVAACSAFFQTLGQNSYTLDRPQAVYTPTYASDGKAGRPKNVILIIGDGMAVNQITAAEICNRGALTLLNMLNVGFIKNWALNANNPDSAGAGTALATGHKTNNRHISTLPSGEAVTNAAEQFSADGRKVGIISSGSITDATPAAQYAHSVERNNSEEIAAWATAGHVDFLAGTNLSAFNKRADGRDLIAELTGKGYEFTTSMQAISNRKSPTICLNEQIGAWTTEGDIHSLSLLTTQAMERLDNPNGFYLMVESAKIDHAGHGNNLRQTVLETLKLDAVVAESLRFADRNNNTLVIVTADHETGGLTILDGDRSIGEVNGFYTSDDHTGLMLPVFAYGVGSTHFCGVYENTEIFHKIKELLTSTQP